MPRGKRSRSSNREGSPVVKYCRVGAQEWVTPEEASKQLRFEEVLAALRATVGLPPASYSSRGEYVFHLYSLFEVVGMHGGFAYACAKSLWGHIAGALCKVSKRQVAAAREAESCYKELLYPFEDRLRALGTVLQHSPDIKMESGPDSMINLLSQSSESQSGGSVKDAGSWEKPSSAKSYSPVQSQHEYALNPMHVIHVKLPGLPYIPRVPVLASTPSSSPPHQNAPPFSLLDTPHRSPWSEWDAINRDTPSGSASNPNASLSMQLADGQDIETLQPLHGLSMNLTGRQGARRGRGRGARGRGRGRPRGGRGIRQHRKSARGRGRACNRFGKRSFNYELIFPSSNPLAEVPDPIPGNPLGSMVRWLKTLATEVKDCVDGSNVDHHAALHGRYCADVITVRDIMSKAARKICKDEARARQNSLPNAALSGIGLIEGKPRRKAAYGRDFTAEAGEVSSCLSDEDGSEESQESKEGEEYQAEIPPWRPRPPVPCKDEFRWFDGKIWPLAEDAFDFRRNDELGHLQETLIPAVPRPDDFLTNIDARHDWVDSSSQILEKLLGPAAKDLGLPFMGYRVRRGWSTNDESYFEEGIRTVGRDFTKLQRFFLPDKNISEIVLYYYNIWKVRKTRTSRIWYEEVNELKVEHRKTKQKEEIYYGLEDVKAQEHKVRLAQRRAIKATLYWMRTAAINPLGVKLLQRGKTWERAVRLQRITRNLTCSDPFT